MGYLGEALATELGLEAVHDIHNIRRVPERCEEARGHGSGELPASPHIVGIGGGLVVHAPGYEEHIGSAFRLFVLDPPVIAVKVPVMEVADGPRVTTIEDAGDFGVRVEISKDALDVVVVDNSTILVVDGENTFISSIFFVAVIVPNSASMTAEMDPHSVEAISVAIKDEFVEAVYDGLTGDFMAIELVSVDFYGVVFGSAFEVCSHVVDIVDATPKKGALVTIVVDSEKYSFGFHGVFFCHKWCVARVVLYDFRT